MEIKDLLSPADVMIEVRALNKVRLLNDLAQRAAFKVSLQANLICEALLKREELGSTGLGGGIAIPHARFRELQRPFGFLARLEHAVEFDAIDGRPIDLIFLLLLPSGSASEQLNLLAGVTRRLRDSKVVHRL